ncbi:VWA domain-containing protein [Pseudonocardia kunmingensis]|uniref:Mg-chelatase subunit ChlD n=1 Tax=Pseudonocardia kunmingensis TaxID=630975 RepID=A0A543D4L4_9PSEU|nr:VWA domain-containing protein [Pseudonocardia kunmingensis]TQM04273.1 Mg-chelatase subunit ChlD [Pseudonocardia kunmingensis]
MRLPGAGSGPRMAPLRRRPKQLTEPPALFRAGTGPPVVTDGAADRGAGAADGAAGGQGTLVTGRRARLRDVAELLEDRPADPEVAAMAQRIARRLAIRRRSREHRGERGAGRIASMPYRYRSDDIDLDRTLEVLTERPVPEDTDIVVRERVRTRRDVVLVVDVSGSMRGEKVRIAAATVAALSADLAGGGDRLALVAFWSDAALLAPLDAPVPADRLLAQLLRIPARGLTDVGFALAAAHAELARSTARRRTTVLLSDAVHNAGPDPRLIARRLPELHVLLEADGEHDAPLAADLARLGRGRLAPIRTHRDVAPALNRLLA